MFPVFLTEHRDCWTEWYEEERKRLDGILPPEATLHHIGSTAIKGIWSKPIIDILIELPHDTALLSYKSAIENAGYLCMSEEADRISFNKGYTEDGFAERVFHLHLRYNGDHDEVYFRDYLNSHPDAAVEYEQLKLGLWKQYEHDRDGYTNAKGEFIRQVTKTAKETGNRREKKK